MFVQEILHFFIIPVILGVIGGLSAYIFRYLIKVFTALYNYLDVHHSFYFYLFTMPLVFYISNLLIRKFLKNHTNVTIDEIAKKISLMSGKFSFMKGFLVLLLTSINLGFGVPIGREGPIAKLGGLVSELFIIFSKVPGINIPIYLSAGVSAAVSATFNAPIAGIIFGAEIIIGKINSYIIIPLIVASATSTLIAREFIGNYTAFFVPHLSYDNNTLLYVPLVGVFFSIVAIVLLGVLKKFRVLRVKYRKWWRYIVVLLGLLVGIVIVITPETRGVGYSFVSGIFEGHYSGSQAIVIMISKMAGVIFSIGSGLFGGLMSPSIFLGTFGGYWFGDMLHSFNLDPRVFALIGSAAMLSGISRAPLRSSIIITELTHSYQLLLPILIASSVTAYLVSKVEAGSYFKRALIQKGIDIENESVQKFLKHCDLSRFVQEVRSVSPDASIKTIVKQFKRQHIRYLPVVENEKLVGVVSLRDVRKKDFFHIKKLTANDIMSKKPFCITQDYTQEDVYKALSILNANFIPFVDEEQKYLGMLNMNKLLKVLTFTQNRYEIR